jgi:hypothetical protein
LPVFYDPDQEKGIFASAENIGNENKNYLFVLKSCQHPEDMHYSRKYGIHRFLCPFVDPGRASTSVFPINPETDLDNMEYGVRSCP